MLVCFLDCPDVVDSLASIASADLASYKSETNNLLRWHNMWVSRWPIAFGVLKELQLILPMDKQVFATKPQQFMMIGFVGVEVFTETNGMLTYFMDVQDKT